jgi:hypothetical protein
MKRYLITIILLIAPYFCFADELFDNCNKVVYDFYTKGSFVVLKECYNKNDTTLNDIRYILKEHISKIHLTQEMLIFSTIYNLSGEYEFDQYDFYNDENNNLIIEYHTKNKKR